MCVCVRVYVCVCLRIPTAYTNWPSTALRLWDLTVLLNFVFWETHRGDERVCTGLGEYLCVCVGGVYVCVCVCESAYMVV